MNLKNFLLIPIAIKIISSSSFAASYDGSEIESFLTQKGDSPLLSMPMNVGFSFESQEKIKKSDGNSTKKESDTPPTMIFSPNQLRQKRKTPLAQFLEMGTTPNFSNMGIPTEKENDREDATRSETQQEPEATISNEKTYNEKDETQQSEPSETTIHEESESESEHGKPPSDDDDLLFMMD